MVTAMPPLPGSTLGERPVTTGVTTKVKRSELDGLEVPPESLIRMLTVAALSAGETAVIDVDELNVTLAATVDPNLTVAPGTDSVRSPSPWCPR